MTGRRRHAAAAIGLALSALAAAPGTRPAGPRAYDCPRVAAAPVIDGDLTDAAWDAVPWGEAFVDLKTGGEAAVRTRAKLAWDGEHLYVAAELASPHVRSTGAKRDAMLYATDNVFEMFIDPDGDARDYAELQINAGNVVMDLLMDKPYVERGWYDVAWDVAGLRSAVTVDGTPDRAGDVDRCWRVELALPWTSLAKLSPKASLPPEPGTAWRIQLARAEHPPVIKPDGTYAPGTREVKPTYSAWSPQPERNLHAPRQWGTVRFSGAPSPAAAKP